MTNVTFKINPLQHDEDDMIGEFKAGYSWINYEITSEFFHLFSVSGDEMTCSEEVFEQLKACDGEEFSMEVVEEEGASLESNIIRLQIQANRSSNPATDAQIKYLAKLMLEENQETSSNGQLSKKQASFLISQYQ